MTITFLRTIDKLISESIIEADDIEIAAMIGNPGCPSDSDIDAAKLVTLRAVENSRAKTLADRQQAFAAYRQSLAEQTIKTSQTSRPIALKLRDIVNALSNTESTPEGILMAFREQGDGGSDDDIEKIWQDMVALGLIKPEMQDDSD